MANVYVGFHDQRSCNRILKPPGGGTSNIFGTDLPVPDVVPQISPKRDQSKQSTTIQHIIQTESSSSSTTTTTKTTEENLNSSVNVEPSHHQNGTSTEVVIEANGTLNAPDVAAVLTTKLEEIKIEERSTKSEVSETDTSGNNKVLSNESSTEGSVQLNSSFKQGSSIGDILKQDEMMEEKKKVKSPTQRVPPGGYSSGLW